MTADSVFAICIEFTVLYVNRLSRFIVLKYLDVKLPWVNF